MAARALLFDLDGTLWDSAQAYARALEEICGVSAAKSRRRLANGESIVTLLREGRVTKQRYVRSLVPNHLPALYPGVNASLDYAKQRRTALGIVTSLPGSIARPILEAHGLRKLFKVCIDAGCCRTPKPSPAGLRMALRDLKMLADEQIVYVGDRKVDYLAAVRAGICFAWVAWGYEAPAPGLVPNIKVLARPAAIRKL